jgi:hypothetical protein
MRNRVRDYRTAPGVNNEDRITIREHVEVLMRARDREFEAYKREQEQRIILAAQVIEQRLQGLNELRSDVVKDRNQFVTRSTYDAEMDARDLRIASLENWKAKATGAGVILTLFAGAVGAAIARLIGGG